MGSFLSCARIRSNPPRPRESQASSTPDFKASVKKNEGVEQRALADAVLADHRRHAGECFGLLLIPEAAECYIL